jgi:hypothetical protein
MMYNKIVMPKKEPEIKQKTTFSVRLTRFELLHLRDLFSITFAPEMKVTVSQALATSQDRVLIEAKLWQKVATASTEAGLPMDESAHDFVVAPPGPPPMSDFELSSEPKETQHDDGPASGLFEDVNDEIAIPKWKLAGR